MPSPFTGTTGNDTYNGAGFADTFNMVQGGDDTVSGLGGNDSFDFGGALTAADKIDGGTGEDTVTLQGAYGAQLVFSPTTMVSVEHLTLLDGGTNYNLKLDDATVAPGGWLQINANGLTGPHRLLLDASAETNGLLWVMGSNGNDVITTGGGDDIIATAGGAYDVVNTGDGADNIAVMDGRVRIDAGAVDDLITFARAMNAADVVDGGTGFDEVDLSNGEHLALTAPMLVNVEMIKFDGAASFALTSNNANVAAAEVLQLDAHLLAAGVSLTFNGAAETDGSFHFIGGAGDDRLTGGAQADVFEGQHGGADTFTGGGGFDVFSMGGGFGASDRINGGGGSGDTLQLDGDYALGVMFQAATLTNVEDIQLAAGHSYKLVTHDATVGAGRALTIDGGGLDAAHGLTLNGSAETDGRFVVYGGAGADTVVAGAGADIVNGGDGNDTVNGGAGDDHLDGGAGEDTVSYSTAGAGVTVSLAKTVAQNTGGAGRDVLSGFENLTGSAFADHLIGDGGINMLRGGAGDDVINGGGGPDSLTGGTGADTFQFASLIPPVLQSSGLITDFATGDRIDLHLIDADTALGGNQAFHLGATVGHTGDIVVSYDAVQDQTTLGLYTDGDAVSDGIIVLSGHHVLSATDFVM